MDSSTTAEQLLCGEVVPGKKHWVEAVGIIKLSAGCGDERCLGYPNGIPSVLTWDHRPGQVKLFEVSQAAQGRSRTGRFVQPAKGNEVPKGIKWPDMLAEMAKCDVVCRNCHAVRTVERLTKPGPPAG